MTKIAKPKLNILYVPIDSLRPSEYNPRFWSKEAIAQLKESVKRYGFVDPLLVNSANNRKNIVIGGHFRLSIAKELGIKEVPVVYINIPDIEKEKELNIRLNKNLGDWDWGLLADFDEDFLAGIGFSDEEMDQIFGLEIDEEFDVERELNKVLAGGLKGVKDGDLWQLGEHRLVIGDCVERKNWKKVLGQEKFDFLFSDPPYKLSYARRMRKIKTNEGTKLKKDRVYESVGMTDKKGRFKGWVKTKNGFGYRGQRSYLGVEKRGGVPGYDEWLSLANKFQNPKGANVMIFENWRNTVELWQALEKYWRIKNMVIWWLPNRCQGFSRPGFFFQKYDVSPLAGEGILNEGYEEELENYLKEKGQKLLDTYEVILYGQQGKAYWDKKKGTRWARVNDHITWTAETEKSGGQNIVFGTKPIQVLVPYIKILSPRNGIVVDCFAGSGSTIIASEIMKRKCRAIEVSEIYAEVILSRWEKFTGKKAKKL